MSRAFCVQCTHRECWLCVYDAITELPTTVRVRSSTGTYVRTYVPVGTLKVVGQVHRPIPLCTRGNSTFSRESRVFPLTPFSSPIGCWDEGEECRLCFFGVKAAADSLSELSCSVQLPSRRLGSEGSIRTWGG